MVQEALESRNKSDIRDGEKVQNEVEDIEATSVPPTKTLIPKVSTPPTSTTPVSDFF